MFRGFPYPACQEEGGTCLWRRLLSTPGSWSSVPMVPVACLLLLRNLSPPSPAPREPSHTRIPPAVRLGEMLTVLPLSLRRCCSRFPDTLHCFTADPRPRQALAGTRAQRQDPKRGCSRELCWRGRQGSRRLWLGQSWGPSWALEHALGGCFTGPGAGPGCQTSRSPSGTCS